MKRLSLLLLVAALVGCASKPPLPPECEGDLVPINAGANTSMQRGNDAARSRS
jgi:predicted small lipoprotein YifL